MQRETSVAIDEAPVTAAADLLALGRDAHRRGDLARAEHLYRQVLQADPGSADAWHLLGVVATHRGMPGQALEHIDRALGLQANDPAYYLNRGVALLGLQRAGEAIASFRQALALQPGFVQAHNNLANVLYQQGDRRQAQVHWRQAIDLQPEYAEAHHNLARALLDEDQFAAAVMYARHAVRLRPESAGNHRTLGEALCGQLAFEEAAACLREAVRRAPQWPDAHCGLAHVLQKQGQLAEAAAHLQQALHLNPACAEAHNEYGIIRGKEGHPDEAILHFQRALQLRPDYAEAHHNLAVVLKLQRRYDEAVTHLQTVLRLRPETVESAIVLASTLERQGRSDESLACLQQALMQSPGNGSLHCALGGTQSQRGQLAESVASFHEAVRLRPDDAVIHSCLLDALNYMPEVTAEELYAEHTRWGTLHGHAGAAVPAYDLDRHPDRRLRVGYLSGDFIRHVAAHFIEPILAHHDASRVESFCYADVAAGDLGTARLRTHAQQWRPICGLNDEDVAARIRADHIDILVDLGGHTGTRLGVFARRPAPVQVTYLGYPNTTGLSAIQYRLTDTITDPPGEPRCHCEELVHLPGPFCCYQPPGDAPAVSTLPAQTNGFLTFGVLHKLAKLNDQVLDLWSETLRALPSARLLVFRDNLRGGVADMLRGRFAARGIDSQRLLFPEPAPNQNFLAVYNSVDIALDTFPWCGHATSCEALWMGVPVLTLPGTRHAARMVASVLTSAGLKDWIATSSVDFVARAGGWGARVEELAAFRRQLREQVRRSALCDGQRFTAALEEAYRGMWHRYLQNKESPR